MLVYEAAQVGSSQKKWEVWEAWECPVSQGESLQVSEQGRYIIRSLGKNSWVVCEGCWRVQQLGTWRTERLQSVSCGGVVELGPVCI